MCHGMPAPPDARKLHRSPRKYAGGTSGTNNKIATINSVSWRLDGYEVGLKSINLLGLWLRYRSANLIYPHGISK